MTKKESPGICPIHSICLKNQVVFMGCRAQAFYKLTKMMNKTVEITQDIPYMHVNLKEKEVENIQFQDRK